MNRFFIIGNLVRDPELTQTASGISVCRFTVAVNRPTSGDGEKITDYFDCTAWRGTAENIARYCSKGKKIAVIGRVQIDRYEAKDGSKQSRTNVVVEEVEFLTPKDGSQSKPIENKPTGKERLQSFDDDEDIPF